MNRNLGITSQTSSNTLEISDYIIFLAEIVPIRLDFSLPYGSALLGTLQIVSIHSTIASQER